MENTKLEKVIQQAVQYLQLVIKQNGGTKEDTLRLYGEELESIDQLLCLIKDQLNYKKSSKSKIYSQTGVELQNDDVSFLRDGETLYYDYKGKEFDSTQIIDQYEKEQLLGEGGFGKVYKGKNRETGQYVAIKMIDLTEYCINMSAKFVQ